MLAVEGLIKRFGGFTAVSNVSFKVDQGEILGLIGPNGSGKSTIFNMLSGTFPPSAGSIAFEGHEIAGLPPHRIINRGIGRTFQIPRPFRRLTIFENVELAGYFGQGRHSLAKAEEAAERALALVGLSADRQATVDGLGAAGLKKLELAKALEVTKVGVICLTPENLFASWLLFESGALSKTVDKGTRVCTYLLAGLQPQEVPPPLGEFQATKAEKEETRQMLQDVNKSLGSPVAEQTLNNVFDLAWPKLAAQLSALPGPETKVPPKRELEDMVAEILDASRAAARTGQALQEQFAQFAKVERALDRVPLDDRIMSFLASDVGRWGKGFGAIKVNESQRPYKDRKKK